MTTRWKEVAPDAGQKQEDLFNKTIAADSVAFISDEAKTLYQERMTLIKDAVQMKKVPQRIPVCPAIGTFPLEHAGITWKQAMYDYEALNAAYLKFTKDFSVEFVESGFGVTPGRMLDQLGYNMYLWAGHGLADDKDYQYIEKPYMGADEYYDFIDDPTGWYLTVFLPRVCDSLKGLKKFPLLPNILELPDLPGLTLPFSLPELDYSLSVLRQAGEEAKIWADSLMEFDKTMINRGYASTMGGGAKAPFDALGDTLRGMKEIMMDMFRRPELVIEACERITPFMVKAGIRGCRQTNIPICAFPLHKGADGFMTDEQYKTFYWPTLRQVIIALVNEGIVPMLFAEGGYNSRLEFIASDLPRGKVIWFFDKTDMKRAKETIGQNNCVMGNVPAGLLYSGSPDEVKAYCKDLIDEAGKDGGFIFSNGAGLQNANALNIKTMIEFATEYGVYR